MQDVSGCELIPPEDTNYGHFLSDAPMPEPGAFFAADGQYRLTFRDRLPACIVIPIFQQA